jgi:ribosome-binding protein aMBF1 (putative translation factor)
MPQSFNIGSNHQDFEVLHLINKKVAAERAKKKKISSGEATIETKRKYQGDNKMKKLEDDMENLKIETVNTSISKTIREQRTKMNMKQKDLANKINVPVQVIQQYENGKSQTDIKILVKLEKALRCKLTGKGFTK